ncbi:MAG: hypothetical protein GXO23_05595 [Crenarchaeota archaeon]|nr:hypothetical protein [Thermoproteota archaeon]
MSTEIVVPDSERTVRLALGYNVRACADGIILELLYYDHVDQRTYVIGRYYIPLRIAEDLARDLRESIEELKSGKKVS